ncbi:MAG: PHP domain-containing protein [Clostridiales bacterium]|nr:PHP domain-containing protein [Clostridiales bacterium]
MAVDLHCHTRLSDGSLGIDDLIVLAKKRGLSAISITDHDCLAGTIRGKIIGERHGVSVIPGVELSCTDHKTGRSVHLICYLCDYPDRLEGLCRRNLMARKKASQYMMLKLAQRFPITPDLVIKCATGSTCVYKQHMVHALMECGLTDKIYGDSYEDLFKDKENGVLVECTFPDPEETLEAIHEAGGIAVLAHPYLYDSIDVLNRLIPLGLDGIEVWHPSATDEQQRALQQIARRNSLIMTGGSDFHGMYSYNSTCIGSVSVPDSILQSLISYKNKMRRKQQKENEAAAAAKATNE